ncbi:hypothetical protein EMIHUDRAFT_208126 [Emiliania huxleyi CCMP1516]|uniref:Beta-galactosidase n=2 Tax=Emiliania huxleyi TaxID=2903 RepID=A0A0D3JBY5_EMIH1|nr:hypothetical protein EMIHUDRAFT_208126 [Emiliania huxleyi CCMP1516]EOD21020.1 hypothetical protein EMIHUDRAFT_208126 [Emiliania huxleyi CCMP1516]|eukprot:XP_005773449.1 hypothetical protein EMIHUDRAFT_208126 [Emiliania huxleyi CCMP1516]
MVATESYPQQSFESWQAVWENEWLIGDFVWTAMDHLGESALGWTAATLPGKGMLETCLGTSPWPWHISYAGDLDICGFKKPQSFYRNVLWDVSPLEMVVSGPAPAGTSEQISAWGWPDEEVSWTWPSISEGAQVTVKVYSKAHDEVELFVNGARVGRAMRGGGGSIAFVNGSWFRGIERLTATFVVPYSPGNLTAVGHVRATGRTDVRTLLTTGMPAALRLAADRTTICASRNDLAYVTVYVVDSAGRHVNFDFEGDGELYRVGNGDPRDLGSFQQPRRTTHRGRVLAVLRPKANAAGGTLTLRAAATGLAAASVTLQTKACPLHIKTRDGSPIVDEQLCLLFGLKCTD